MTATATKPTQGTKNLAAVPFPIASRISSRNSFTTGAITLAASASTIVNPIQIPAVGYLRGLMLEVIVTGTAGTAPAFTPDAPFNVLQSLEFRTASGSDIIVPVTGYQAYQMAKQGSSPWTAPYTDARMGRQYAAVAGVGPSARFFLPIWFEKDAETGWGSIPALASNRSYQLAMTFAGVSTVLSGAPGVTVTVNATAHYWNEPPATTQKGNPQVTEPDGLGTLNLWQYEAPTLTPGDKYIKTNNVGNIMSGMIFILRNASGARIDTNGWPAACEIYLDNEPLLYLPQSEWEDMMIRRYGFTAATKDVAQGLDTGVYYLPFHALAGAMAGDPANTRSQYLATMDTSQLQIRGTWGSAVSTIEILTNSVVPLKLTDVFSK